MLNFFIAFNQKGGSWLVFVFKKLSGSTQYFWKKVHLLEKGQSLGKHAVILEMTQYFQKILNHFAISIQIPCNCSLYKKMEWYSSNLVYFKYHSFFCSSVIDVQVVHYISQDLGLKTLLKEVPHVIWVWSGTY